MSLKGLEHGGGTSLTDAMINGITQLQHYNSCIRYKKLLITSCEYLIAAIN